MAVGGNPNHRRPTKWVRANQSLTLKWFYMTFLKSERDQFIMPGRRLVDEMIESITEYFESLYNIKKSNGMP